MPKIKREPFVLSHDISEISYAEVASIPFKRKQRRGNPARNRARAASQLCESSTPADMASLYYCNIGYTAGAKVWNKLPPTPPTLLSPLAIPYEDSFTSFTKVTPTKPASMLLPTITPPKTITPIKPNSIHASAHTSHNPAGNSTSWQSNRHDTIQKLGRLHNTALHLGIAQSPYFPKTIPEHAKHTVDYKKDCDQEELARLQHGLGMTRAINAAMRGVKKADWVDGGLVAWERFSEDEKQEQRRRLKVGEAMRGKKFDDSKTLVLGEKSIWASAGQENDVSWPRLEELKIDGELLKRAGYGRRFPLPKLNVLKVGDREEMIAGGEESILEVLKMEAGMIPMPFRMKDFAPVEAFDETIQGQLDRVSKGLKAFELCMVERAEELDERETRQSGWLGDLLDQ